MPRANLLRDDPPPLARPGLHGMNPSEGIRERIIFVGRMEVLFRQFLHFLQSENVKCGHCARTFRRILRLDDPMLETVAEAFAHGVDTIARGLLAAGARNPPPSVLKS